MVKQKDKNFRLGNLSENSAITSNFSAIIPEVYAISPENSAIIPNSSAIFHEIYTISLDFPQSHLNFP